MILWVCGCFFFFFFSSRRRHTRFDCDWSSDVCSSDLGVGVVAIAGEDDVLLAQRGEDAAGDRLLSDVDVERSEEHTSELQSQSNLVCRLLLEKKKKNKDTPIHTQITTHHRLALSRQR